MPLLQQAMASFLPFEEINRRGMPASFSYFTLLYDQFTREMLDLVDELSIRYFDDQPINPKSDVDSRALLQRLGLKATKKTKGGLDSTAKDSIEHLRYTHPAMEIFFDWRELQHRQAGFCAPVLDSMTPNNLCRGSTDIHNLMGELLITRTSSRRPSMKTLAGEGINLLNLPSRQGAGSIEGLNKRIRNGFMTPPGESLLSCDQSQVELRILAHESQDPTMLDIYRNDGDIHATTAARMFNLPINELDDSRHRKPAKTVNFMISYGGGGHKLFTIYRQSNITEFDEAQCDKFIEGFYNTYPGVATWKDRLCWQARKDGYVTSHSGMRRYCPNLHSKDRRLRSAAERETVSHKIQTTAQDLIQNSMGYIHPKIVDLRERGCDVWLALQLYDELIHRCEDSMIDEVEAIVMDGLTNHHGMPGCRVPILADSSRGKCWGEL